jgi:hypothetical protein
VTGVPPLPPDAFDGLPAHAEVLAALQANWPWPPFVHELAAELISDWTAQDRAQFEQQIRPACPDGVHWPQADR